MGFLTARTLILFSFLIGVSSQTVWAVTTAYSGNYLIVEDQSGFEAEQYELRVGKKLERGIKNFLLGWLEIPHGVKSHIGYREENYLPVGFETYLVGLFDGFFHALGRTAVGAYEMFTPFYAQGPILVEMEEWFY